MATLRPASAKMTIVVLCVFFAPLFGLAQIPDPVVLGSPYVQYRTYEDDTRSRLVAWIDFQRGGLPVDESAIASIELTGPDGNLLLPEIGPFSSAEFLFASWDPNIWAFGGSSLLTYSGYLLSLAIYDPSEVPAGDYTFKATTSSEDVLQRTVTFPGALQMPVVPSWSMWSQWLPGGGLQLGWMDPGGEFQDYRLIFLGVAGTEVFHGRVDRYAGTTVVDLSPQMVQAIGQLGVSDHVTWIVQTRNYDGGMNYARGYSSGVSIPWLQQVSGRVVDPAGSPLPGWYPTNTQVILQRLTEWGWFQDVGWASPDAEGRFTLFTDCCSVPPAGTYQLEVTATGYEPATVGPQFLQEGEAWNVDDVVLQPLPTAEWVAGRLIDVWSGAPLQGSGPPYAQVSLFRLSPEGWEEWVNWQPTDADGRFRFEVDYNGAGLAVGTYRVTASADGYEYFQASDFALGEGEERDLGDLPLTPFPITIANVVPCEQIPASGGTCTFTFDLQNHTPKRFQGATWSQVDGWGMGSLTGSTRFQTASKGTKKPTEQLSLRPGEMKTIAFEFAVPGWLPEMAGFCLSGFVGQDPDALFNTVAESFFFCVQKVAAGLELVPEAKARRMLQSRNPLRR